MSIIVGVLLIVIIIYLMAIMPRICHRPDFKPFAGVLYAHRGFFDNDSNAPENSQAAFRLAIRHGYGIEMDVQLSKDKVPVIFHDYTLLRMCGLDRRVDELTLEELKQLRLAKSSERIPTFEEALRTIDGKTPLIIEYKVEGSNLEVCEKAMPILDQYHGQCCMESFNPLVLNWFKKNRKEMIRGQLSSNFMVEKEKGSQILYFLLSRLLLNFLARPDFIAYNYKYPHLLSLVLCRKLYGIATVAWTIKNQKEYEESKDTFDAIIFDSFIPRG